ncbi:hypothetical protein KI387_023373, partial [Taxus chinensis]
MKLTEIKRLTTLFDMILTRTLKVKTWIPQNSGKSDGVYVILSPQYDLFVLFACVDPEKR